MRTCELAVLSILALVPAGCVTRTHEENAARRSTWPADAAPLPASASGSNSHWPSVEGDILRGTSPADLAAAREAVGQPLTEALAKP